MANPLVLFPLEIWEMILDNVFDSETVYSVLQIYPQLDEAFQKKKHVWLLGKILPFITTWTNLLEEEELRNCRLGCKNFIRQVDHFLENQPWLRPYHPNLQSDDQFRWNSKAHLGEHYEELLDDTEDKKVYYFGGVKFEMGGGGEEKNSARDFLKEFGTNPEENGWNPFLARSLSVKAWSLGWNEEDNGRVFQFLLEVRKVLERFGKHIWFFSLNLEVDTALRGHTWSWLSRCLSLLPNLKSLDLTLDIETNQKVSRKKPFRVPPINLPPLESIRMSGTSLDAFATRILGCITAPIRRLVLDFGDWRDDHSRLLSTVTEFKLEDIWIRRAEDWTRLRNLLLSMEAPQLVKLELEIHIYADSEEDELPVSLEEDIFTWIKHFPSLRYLDIGNNSSSDLFIQEKGTLLPERDSHPSLQFLCIHDSFALSYNFLLCLPSLQHLKLYVEPEPEVVDLSNEKVVRIREQIETGTMHTSNVWELLPNLRSVSIYSESYQKEFKCDREKVNYFKEHPDYQGFNDWREDIWRTLENEKQAHFDDIIRVDVDNDNDNEDTFSSISDPDPDREDNHHDSPSDADSNTDTD